MARIQQNVNFTARFPDDFNELLKEEADKLGISKKQYLMDAVLGKLKPEVIRKLDKIIAILLDHENGQDHS